MTPHDILMAQIAAHAAKKQPHAQDIQSFIPQFFHNVDRDGISNKSPEELSDLALRARNSIQCRKEDERIVRVSRLNQSTGPQTIIEIISDDMPFLLDSLSGALQRMEKDILLMIHPVMRIRRDKDGQLVEMLSMDGSAPPESRVESLIQVLIPEEDIEREQAIKAELDRVFHDVYNAVTDYGAMKECLENTIEDIRKNPPPLDREEVAESLDFLTWLCQYNFTFLGVRACTFKGENSGLIHKINPGSLGVLKGSAMMLFDGLRNLGHLPEDIRTFLVAPSLLRISKANKRARVHRTAHMDTIAVKRFDATGQVIGETLFAGLFTSSAYGSPLDIPLLRQKIKNVIARAGFREGSHDGKALCHTLETFPRHELFETKEDDLFDSALRILHLRERVRVALFVRQDPFKRFISCLVYIPRDRFDTKLRQKVTRMICATYNGTVSSFSVHLGNARLARIHFIIKMESGQPPSIPNVNVKALEQQIAEATRSWEDRLDQVLNDKGGFEKNTLNRWVFPLSYQENFSAAVAIEDLVKAREAEKEGDLALNLYQRPGEDTERLCLKIYLYQTNAALSDLLPMLENMGLKVLSETPYLLTSSERKLWIHDFEMVTSDHSTVDLDHVRDAFHTAFAAVWRKRMENDGFNRLVLSCAFTVRDVTILRAYCCYLLQARIPFSRRYMEKTLTKNPKLTTLLLQLFTGRFLSAGANYPTQDNTIDTINTALKDVENRDEDHIIQRFCNVIANTLRTNAERYDARPESCLSFKIDSGQITDLPLPRPFREIFVYGTDVEGVHLRFGPVARGGLRWSDRREDFRTEILGLVKAQHVKNAVIVPVGSKGGFIVKNPPAGRDALQEKGITCYKIFIRGLLDLTDNIVEGQVIPPQDVVRHDGDDPYLVVAADKGTARFSDIANAICADYNFWLGDAFASGGSAGYDHKGMGITARGAWESVKRHFRELGKDIQNSAFTVIGVGDMAGDVFGNGMLLSRQIRLQAAFNHQHIFIDPTPDPAQSWRERKRLFDQPGSSWADYNPALISKGGGVFGRKAKSISLTPEMKDFLDLDQDSLSPDDLIRAILRAKVELLWFGGIGTYVKSSDESHANADDRANDALRIDAQDLGCKVIGEGANLGITQQARIEFGREGGKINTDFLDNSAGVDCSDHEVNIKILLGAVERRGELTRPERDKLLGEMTEDVAALVLRDNYLQSQSISVTAIVGKRMLGRIVHYMHHLEKQGLLNRALAVLPNDEDIAERKQKGQGLERAELVTMLSYAKIALYGDLIQSDLPDDPAVRQELINYFPRALQQRYSEIITQHSLRREIIATALTNDIVNRTGITFVHDVHEKTGFSADAVVRAWRVIHTAFDMNSLYKAIEDLDNRVITSLQADLLADCGRLVEQATVWLLRNSEHPIDMERETARLPVSVLANNFDRLLPDDDKNEITQRVITLVAAGVPEPLAKRLSGLRALGSAGDITRIANACTRTVEDASRIYFAVGQTYGINSLRKAARALPGTSVWDKLAVNALIDDLLSHQAELSLKILHFSGPNAPLDTAIEQWATAHSELVSQSEGILSQIILNAQPDYAMLAVANSQLKNMVTA